MVVESRVLHGGDAPELCALYATYGWWEDRTPAQVERALEQTDLAIGLVDDGECIAAARVISDFTFYATVFDIIVHADRRGAGLGEQLVAEILDRLEPTPLERITLYCRDGLEPFYEAVGFERAEKTIAIPEGGQERLLTMYYEYEN
ncbi:GNAT family N-acetyltransferase [Halocatena halophila]|uniref:GNAT family N-acetyltransferase n=1 Tax=Halocatena halophila TaxID=2814576 RepID=UPI002ED4B6F7